MKILNKIFDYQDECYALFSYKGKYHLRKGNIMLYKKIINLSNNLDDFCNIIYEHWSEYNEEDT